VRGTPCLATQPWCGRGLSLPDLSLFVTLDISAADPAAARRFYQGKLVNILAHVR
jgi:hypothetical protein